MSDSSSVLGYQCQLKWRDRGGVDDNLLFSHICAEAAQVMGEMFSQSPVPCAPGRPLHLPRGQRRPPRHAGRRAARHLGDGGRGQLRRAEVRQRRGSAGVHQVGGDVVTSHSLVWVTDSFFQNIWGGQPLVTRSHRSFFTTTPISLLSLFFILTYSILQIFTFTIPTLS